MDAFEHVVAELFWARGYWVRTSVKVNVTKAEKASVGNPYMPNPEIDLVTYSGGKDRLLALECKSYFDSRGVTYAEVCGSKQSKTYKLFRKPELREMVLNRLQIQLVEQGFCRPGVMTQLDMIAGKVSGKDEPKLLELFEEQDWVFRGPQWGREELSKLAATGYESQISTVVTKILLRK